MDTHFRVNDIYLAGPFSVFDLDAGHFIFTWTDRAAPGDLPPDIALLPVIGLRKIGDMLIIDTVS